MDPSTLPCGTASGRGAPRSRPRGGLRPGVVALLAGALLLATPSEPAAHEIPANVTVRLLAHHDGDRLRMLVRVPMEALRDIEWPVRGPQRALLVGEAHPLLRDAARMWVADYLRLEADGRSAGDPEVAAVRVSLPNDRSFRSWETARAHMDAPPVPDDLGLVPEQGLMDVLLEWPVPSAASDLVLVPELAHLGIRTTTVLAVHDPDRAGGADRVLQYVGDPGAVRLDPGWHHAVGRFLTLGFEHILGGIDHLLFLLVLVVPFRRVWPLVPVVTAFTVGHSVTLAAAALGLAPGALWFPPLVETLIAASIVWMALENILGARLERRWMWAFGFGLVHGFGFSFLLRESLQFAGAGSANLLAALAAFNVGVELGQLLVLAVAVPALVFLFRRVPSERMAAIVLSALLAHTAWHWMTERGSAFLAHDLALPALDLFLLADLMRWGMLALIAAGAGWLTGRAFHGLRHRLPGRLDPLDALEPNPEPGQV